MHCIINVNRWMGLLGGFAKVRDIEGNFNANTGREETLYSYPQEKRKMKKTVVIEYHLHISVFHYFYINI